MDFDTWLDKAWDDHADDAAAVATRAAGEGAALAATDAQLGALARLTHHLYGDHLGRFADGQAALAALARHPACGAEAGRMLKVLDAALALADGADADAPALDTSGRIRATALAAGDLALRDTPRAAALLKQASDDAEDADLAAADPAHRALAVAGNNIACAMEDKAARSDAERTLMIAAARTGRTYWERAGSWLEVERAEYRLAMSWLAAGDVAQARRHAQECLAIVREHDAPALEAFFGWEALGRVERAAGNATGHAHALAQARAAFERLAEGDQGWCRASLDKLAAT
jgi:hypothetical protein